MNEPDYSFDDSDYRQQQQELSDYNDSMAYCHCDGWFYHDSHDNDPPNSDHHTYQESL